MTIPTSYDPARARILAAASAEAYLPPRRGYPIYCGETDTRVLVLGTSTDVIIAFRGTANLRDWLTDLDCGLFDTGSFRVHHGFLRALRSVFDELAEVLAEMRGTRVWMTGHSLGGALAMLAARFWRGPVAGVYTFGQPRAGDAAFRDNYNFCLGPVTYRIVHADDVVARVPWLLGRYRHAGQEVFFPAPPGSEWRIHADWRMKLASDLRGLAREAWHGRDALLADHHLDKYLTLLRVAEGELAAALSEP